MHRTLCNESVKLKMMQLFQERQHPGIDDVTLSGLFRDEASDIIEGIGM